MPIAAIRFYKIKCKLGVSPATRVGDCPRGFTHACSDCHHVKQRDEEVDTSFKCLDMNYDNIEVRCFPTGEDDSKELIMSYKEFIIGGSKVMPDTPNFAMTFKQAVKTYDIWPMLSNNMVFLTTNNIISFENQ